MDFLQQLSKLYNAKDPFALATVVSCENPTSAKPGAKAIILADGTLHGWIGGSCAQPIVIKEAQEALKTGLPKLLKIGTKEASEFGRNNGVQEYEMTCFSGGAMEIFIEPVLPKAQLILVGNSPDLQVLAQLGEAAGYAVRVFDPEVQEDSFRASVQISPEIDFSELKNVKQTYFVVATHGRHDEEALKQALATDAPYVGLVSSKKRAEAIFAYLKKDGITQKDWDRVKTPAGLNIGARTPEEIAVSILAEIVEQRGKNEVSALATATQKREPAGKEAVDPICGMTVQVKGARFKTSYQGQHYYFCCAGCLQKFDAAPEAYLQNQLA